MAPDWRLLAELTANELQAALLAEADAVMDGKSGPGEDRLLPTLPEQLVGVDDARPARRASLTRLDNRVAELRDQLRATDAALRALSQGDNETSPPTVPWPRWRQNWTKGRTQPRGRPGLRRSPEQVQHP